jgi:hypothetical protein
MRKMKTLFKGFIALFAFVFASDSDKILGYRANIGIMLLILGIIGIIRNFLEVAIGGPWARAWFALKPDIFFTMIFYPIFLCFFSTTLLYFFSHLVNLKVKIKELLSLFFLMQCTHLIIPFLDGLAHLWSIPHNYLVPLHIYKKMIFTPLAFTPLIMFFTRPTSLGIDIVWLLVTIILVKLYTRNLGHPLIKSLLVLGSTFYIIYLSVYPTYSFFLNERIIGSNFMFGLFFLFLSIPSVIFVYTLSREEKEKEEEK